MTASAVHTLNCENIGEHTRLHDYKNYKSYMQKITLTVLASFSVLFQSLYDTTCSHLF